ncbi:MAG: CotH kinase family protein [Cytophagaceae bacterium]|jgi:hypothetical protein|nr:CotH kinase family protein [Cytophagaceae bacterium]
MVSALKLCFLLLSIGVLSFSVVQAQQIMINEVSSNNFSVFPDNDGDFNDWIELYNPIGSPVNLQGYRLSDDPAVPTKWTFPNISIPANGYLTIHASGKNKIEFVDHWESLVKENNIWRFTIPNASTPTNWNTTGFADGAWAQGPGGIGYGDADDATIVTPNPASVVYLRHTFNLVSAADIQYLILHVDYDDGFVAYLNGIEIANGNVSGAPSYNTFADSDREAVMYSGGTPDEFIIPSSVYKNILVDGPNVLAISVHNRDAASSDMTCRPFLTAGIGSAAINYQTVPGWFVAPSIGLNLHTNFSIKESGETILLYNNAPTPALVSSIAVPRLQVDDTYGRFPNGSLTWRFLQPATPNASNGTSTPSLGYLNNPVVFSLPAGYYTGTQTLSLSSITPGVTIRYTIDGTKPNASSAVYTAPLSIPSTRVVRAAAFLANFLPGGFETNSYFINDNTTMGVVSISTAPANFFDNNTGIYVDGTAATVAACPDMPYRCRNFWQDWEREIHIEYFDKLKNFQFEQDAGVKILGGWSRTLQMKSMQIRAGDKYGKKTFEYSFYNEPKKSTLDQFESFTLRNGGNDFNYTHLRDATNQRTLNSMLPCVDNHCDFEAYIPVLVYINGQYWGVHHLRERVDDTYFENNFGLTDDEIDYGEFNGTPKKGSTTEFLQMVDFVNNNNMTVAANYDNLQNNMLDIKNYVDYLISETYHTNWDWPHNNIKFWQPRAVGGKWRFILHDTDFGLGLFNFSSATTNELNRVLTDTRSIHSPFFQKLLTNTTFRNYFISRYADLINTIYSANNYKSVLNSLKNELNTEMTRHFTRWPHNSANVAGWNTAVSGIETFMDGRPAQVRTQINAQFALSGQVNVTLQVNPAGAGRIRINTITPCSLPWTGVYFNGVPVTIEVIPNDGYQFVNWSSGLSLPSTTNTVLTMNIPANGTITANFGTTTNIPKLCVSEINYNADSSSASVDSGDWLELQNTGTAPLNLSGWKVKDSNIYNEYTIPNGTILQPGQYLVLVSNVLKFQTVHPTVSNFIGPLGFNLSNGGERIELYNTLGEAVYTITYDDVAPWPLIADGYGATLELQDCSLNPNQSSSWFAGCKLGSPGTSYVPCPCLPANLGPDAVLCITGSPLIVSSGLTAHPNRTFTWFKDGVKLLATTPTLSITTTGNYSVLVDSLGCFKSDAMRVNAALSVNLGPDVSLCSPMIDTLNTQLSASGVTFVWQRNSITIPGAVGSKIPVNTPGTYQVNVSGGTCTPVSDQVVVSSVAAVPVDAERCGAGVLNLSVTGSGSFQWYNTPTGGASIASGSSYSPNLSSTTTFYVQDASFYSNRVGPKDTTFGDVWFNSDYSYKLKFTVASPLQLNFITVYTDGPQTVTIRVLDPAGTGVLHSKTFNITSAGKQRLALGFNLAANISGQEYFMDAVGTTGSLMMNNENSNFPYTVPGYLSIVRGSPSWTTQTNNWYLYFYNWEFSNKPGPCDRVPVTGTINCVLPVDYAYFQATNQGAWVRLDWATTQEVNSERFVVERSTDGMLFYELPDVIPAQGNSNSQTIYSAIDQNPPNGKGYYRIKQVDKDGTAHWTAVQVVYRSKENKDIFVSPNPFLESCQLKQSSQDPLYAEILELNGKVRWNGHSSLSSWELGKDLSPGFYILKVLFNDEWHTFLLTKL